MFVNKYIQDRREREKVKGLEKKEEVKPLSPKPRWGEVLPMPRWEGRPPLQEVEKKNETTQSPLPGGGWRDLSYQGPLKEKELDTVEKNYPIYKEVERQTGVNWKVIAAVHYRESDFGMNGVAKGNEFRFSGSLRSRATGDLLHDAIDTGKILQEKAKAGGVERLQADQSDGENVRVALFRYNGTGYRNFREPGAPVYDRSPYVMNQIDDQHRNMKKYRVDHEPSPTGIDRQMGAVLVIQELGKAFVE